MSFSGRMGCLNLAHVVLLLAVGMLLAVPASPKESVIQAVVGGIGCRSCSGGPASGAGTGIHRAQNDVESSGGGGCGSCGTVVGKGRSSVERLRVRDKRGVEVNKMNFMGGKAYNFENPEADERMYQRMKELQTSSVGTELSRTTGTE